MTAGAVETGKYTHVVRTFRGPYSFLSNFRPARVMYEGDWYETVEHAYHAAKVDRYAERILKVPPYTSRWRVDIRLAGTPAYAKVLGRQVPLRANWDDLKVEIMRSLLIQKFAYGTTYWKPLMDTKGAELVEGNTWHDTFWGRCTCLRHKGQGENMLGILLMAIRDR